MAPFPAGIKIEDLVLFQVKPFRYQFLSPMTHNRWSDRVLDLSRMKNHNLYDSEVVRKTVLKVAVYVLSVGLNYARIEFPNWAPTEYREFTDEIIRVCAELTQKK